MSDRAVLVGIDKYPDPRNNLNSCVNDTNEFKVLLEQQYNFTSANVRVLHNEMCTLVAVRQALDWLFASPRAGDHLVFFESSHGYRYPKGDTMIEVLCLYDQFLEDHELSGRTQALPPGVLTVIIDACHSGGMNKVFFPGNAPAVAKAKVWQPPLDRAEDDAGKALTITRFKSFGRTTASETASVLKAFGRLPAGTPAAPPTKDITAGQVDLNGVLLAACRAEQTAAAGSAATNFLSAFTYALKAELDAALAVSDLVTRSEVRLRDLRMQQEPTLQVPRAQPELEGRTFITMRAAGSAPLPTPAPAGGGTWLDALRSTFDNLFNKEFDMPQPVETTESELQKGFAEFTKQLEGALAAGPSAKGYAGADASPMGIAAACELAGPLLACVHAAQADPAAKSKVMSIEPPSAISSDQVGDPKFWGAVFTAVTTLAPYVVDALTKDFQDPRKAIDDAVSEVPPEYLQNKDWLSFVTQAIATLGPPLVQAITGTKDFTKAGDAPSLVVPAAYADDKGFLSSAFRFVRRTLPVAVPALLRAMR